MTVLVGILEIVTARIEGLAIPVTPLDADKVKEFATVLDGTIVLVCISVITVDSDIVALVDTDIVDSELSIAVCDAIAVTILDKVDENV